MSHVCHTPGIARTGCASVPLCEGYNCTGNKSLLQIPGRCWSCRCETKTGCDGRSFPETFNEIGHAGCSSQLGIFPLLIKCPVIYPSELTMGKKENTRKRLLPPPKQSAAADEHPTPLPDLRIPPLPVIPFREFDDESNLSGNVSITSGAIPHFGRLSRGRRDPITSRQRSSVGAEESGVQQSIVATNQDEERVNTRRSFRKFDISKLPVSQSHEDRWGAAQASVEDKTQTKLKEGEEVNCELQLQAQRQRIAELMRVTQERRILEKEEQRKRSSRRINAIADEELHTSIPEEASMSVASSAKTILQVIV